MPTEAEIQRNADALVAFTRAGDRRATRQRPVENLTPVRVRRGPSRPFRGVWARVLAVTEWASVPVVTAALVAGLHAVGLA